MASELERFVERNSWVGKQGGDPESLSAEVHWPGFRNGA